MKTTIEIKGYMIEVEEKDGNIFVKALSGDEVIEEFEINLEGDEDDIERSEDDIDSDTDDDNENEIKDFDDFAQEDDFDDSNDVENNVERKTVAQLCGTLKIPQSAYKVYLKNAAKKVEFDLSLKHSELTKSIYE